MATGDLHIERIILGAILGVGAVAAAPFIGGGSVLGAATLAASLSGFGTGLAAATAGVVGAALVDGLGDDADFDAYNEGYEEARNKYATREILEQEEREREEMMDLINSRRNEERWGPML